ncbi:hypothetical protein K8T06_11335 [bacterium]|nr:hypothetical protein [bacterium]
MKLSTTILLTLFFMCAISGMIPVVQAGLFDISLGLDVYGSIDDNILLLSDEELDLTNEETRDEILQIRPSIQVGYEGTRSSFRIRYELFKEWYNKDHNLDRTPTSYHDGYINGTYELTNRFSLGFYDRYKDALYGTSRIEVPDIRDDYKQNHLEPSIKYSGIDGRWSLSLKGFWGFMDYEEAPIVLVDGQIGFADWAEYGAKADLSFALLTRTQFVLHSSFWTHEYEVSDVAEYADQFGYNISSGVIQEFGEGMALTALVSFNHREYDRKYHGSDDVYSGVGGTLSFVNQISGLSRWEIGAFSRFEESERVAGAFYRDTGFKTVFYSLFSERFEGSIDVSYSTLDYENVDEEWSDDYFQSGIKLGYKVAEWMSVRGQYVYSRRSSDHDQGEFENNLLSLYLQFRHNLFY